MNSLKQRFRVILYREATAWAVLAASLMMTAAVWLVSNRFLEQEGKERFAGVCRLAQDSIQGRMIAYQQVLRAAAGFIEGSEQVSRKEWQRFVATLHLADALPGIQGLGYAVMLKPSGKAGFEAAVRQEGFPGFAIRPAGERETYSAILYLEPFDWRNRRALGYDMFSDPVRREAMERARDTGRIAMSGGVILVQEADRDVHSGVLMYLPLYRKGAPLNTEEERRAALEAFVLSPFRMGDLMRGILGPSVKSLNLELYDEPDVRPAALLYRSDGQDGEAGTLVTAGKGTTPAASPRHSVDLSLEVAGKTWTAHLSSTPQFEAETSSIQPALIGSGGILADFLLFGVLFSVSRNGRLLAREKMRFESALESAPVAMVMVDQDGRIELVNANFERLFGYPRDELLGREIEMLLPAALSERHAQLRESFMGGPQGRRMAEGRELFGLKKDGSLVPLEIALSAGGSLSAHAVVATVVDITERKRHLDALQERETRYRGVVETSPDGFWLTDARGRFITINDAYCRMSGYSREELLQRAIPHLEAKESREEVERHIARVFEMGFDRFETVHRRKDGSLWPAEVSVSTMASLGEMAVFVRDLTEIKALEVERIKAEEVIRDMAFHDALTGLPNRRLLVDRLRQAMAAARRNRHHGALLFIDLDNFKQLNDSLGHEMGDLLLVQVAQRLKACVREQDTAARLGGDEFVVMLVGLDGGRDESLIHVRGVGAKILDALNQPYQLGQHLYQSTPSIGATLFLDDEEEDAIFRRADGAMYQVKKTGRNALHLFGEPA
jgi:diguanylate cyclase (GGDEF)-like protein/PAS domain S-box-containing protein